MTGMDIDENNYARHNESAFSERKNDQPIFASTQKTFAGTDFKQSQVDNEDY